MTRPNPATQRREAAVAEGDDHDVARKEREMHDILKNRLMRKLEGLPEERLYQVLDYIEFLESRYGGTSPREPGGVQRFAERLEDRMRARAVVPTVMSGTMRVFGAAGRVLDGVSEVGRGLIEGIEEGIEPRPRRPVRIEPVTTGKPVPEPRASESRASGHSAAEPPAPGRPSSETPAEGDAPV